MKYKIDYFTKKFENMQTNVELAALGSTQAHFAFDFSRCGLKAVNLSMTENGLSFHKPFLLKYRSHIKENAVILITIEYPIFLCKETPKDRYDLNVQYARCLFGYNPNLTLEEERNYLCNPYEYIKAPLYQQLINGLGKNPDCNHLRMYEIEREIRGLIREGWESAIAPIKIFGYDSELYTEVRKQRLLHSTGKVLELVECCKDNRWIPVLVGLPYSKELSNRVSTSFISDAFYDPINQIIETTGISFLDYSTDQEFESIQNYFNTWFLNEMGSVRFTQRVIDDLKKMSLLRENEE